MTVECKECGWEGEEEALEYFKCPRCSSRNLRTDGARKSNDEDLNPPEGAMEGGMGA